MTTTIVSLNRKKGSIKAQLTRLETLLADETAVWTKIKVTARLKGIEKISYSVDVLRNEYYITVPETEDMTELESELLDIEARIDELEVSFNQLLNIEKTENKSYQNSDNNTECNSKIRLPEIPLPQFNGRYEEWNAFKKEFNNIIACNNQLTEVQKLHYLHASLKGEARLLETQEDTFESLFNALKNRFENKKILVNIHIKAILEFEKLSHESSKDLRNLVDTVNKNIRSLNNLGFSRNEFSDILMTTVILEKLDKDTRKQFEQSINASEVPSFDNLLEFIEKRSQTLASLSKNLNIKTKVSNEPKAKAFLVNSNNSERSCVICSAPHPIYKCSKFLNMTFHERFIIVKKHKLCLRCLSSNSHFVYQCKSKHLCKKCNSKHNTLLHKDDESQTFTPTDASEIAGGMETNFAPDKKINLSNQLFNANKYVILPTAVIKIKAKNGDFIEAKTFLDSCSQINCISSNMTKKLSVKGIRINSSVACLNGSTIALNYKIQTVISNRKHDFTKQLEFFIVPKITELSTIKPMDVENLDIPKDIYLADPHFSRPEEIDLLLGAECFFELLKPRQIRTPQNLLFQETSLGFVACGTMNTSSSDSKYCALITGNDKIEDTLQKFWEVENINESSVILSDEEKFCENHFEKTHYRTSEGQYVVHMPMKDSALLGESKKLAVKRLNQVWQRLDRDSNLQHLYSDFMREYKNLNHMKLIEETDSVDDCYYLPHHGVYRPEKSSTPLRVVYNASAPTSSGLSLNDILLKGKIPQEELFSIMIRFRKHRYAFTADIQKMYRMVLVHPPQRNFLRIVWKESIDAPIQIYELNTITYGTSNAPYLATRALKQLALDEAQKLSLASSVALTDFYIDDILSGESSLEKAKLLQAQIIELLDLGKMKLHKWCANHPDLLMSEKKIDNEYSFDDQLEIGSIKTLGVLWNPKSDCFTYKLKIPERDTFSKRDVLSLISKIFDPLGLIGPVVTKAKVFMQKLWLCKIDWNESLPDSIAGEWSDFVSTLTELQNLKIPRLVFHSDRFMIHGFADASSAAYGAVIYVQCLTVVESSTIQLLCSKSRVAPIKTMSIPRLELSACLLLSRLIHKVLPALKVEIENVNLWTDSTISLAWIRKSPHLLKTFVSNRVALIQELTSSYQWKHISSESNPADVISRGLNADDILSCNLWWHGPHLLHEEVLQSDPHLDLEDCNEYELELKPFKNSNLFVSESSSLLTDILNRTNDYLKLIRIFSYLFRFLYNCRHLEKIQGALAYQELQLAEDRLLKFLQKDHFSSEIAALKKGDPVPHKSKLKLLNPFLDAEGLIRVGGRLKHSSLDYNQKHPIVLPPGNKLVKIIFQHFHNRDFHVGPQSLLNTVRLKYWPLGGRNMARKVVHECVKCFRAKPIIASQMMGDLPPERVTPSLPFLNVGLDLCGPFEIKYKGQRKGTLQKIYVAIFVCMVTKAVHLEFVSDLTSAAIIATLKRFFSRRGKSSIIFSDNATNFVGASTELKHLQTLVQKNENIISLLASEGISWRFLPPRAPNFGGLWEAGVKAFKYHLKRVVGPAKLTLEEFLTVTVQIEGILNSRPLTPLSSDTDNFEVLTPGHFLIGKPINAIPEPNLLDKRDNLLDRWERTQKLVQIVWKRWQNNYLSHLQQRSKWLFKKQNIAPGMLVLLQDAQLPICTWSLGRLVKVIPGSDGNVRVADVRTPKGIFRRPISKISVLPIKDNIQNQYS